MIMTADIDHFLCTPTYTYFSLGAPAFVADVDVKAAVAQCA